MSSPGTLPISAVNPRAERTREKIFTAVAGLLATPDSKVSVTDIVRTAGISRSSFYAHFASLDEVAAELLRAQFVEIDAAGRELRHQNLISGRNAATVGYRQLVAHLVQHIPLYSNVQILPLARHVYDSTVRDYVRQLLDTVITLDSVPRDVNATMAATYTAAGALGLVTSWIRGELDASDDEITRELVELLPRWRSEAQP